MSRSSQDSALAWMRLDTALRVRPTSTNSQEGEGDETGDVRLTAIFWCDFPDHCLSFIGGKIGFNEEIWCVEWDVLDVGQAALSCGILPVRSHDSVIGDDDQRQYTSNVSMACLIYPTVVYWLYVILVRC